MFIVLALFYPLAIQYQRGGYWRLLAPFTLLTAIIDVYCNYTELALLTWDYPRNNEITFSIRCARLIHQDGWVGKVGRFTQKYCNFFMAGHIQ